MAGAILAPGPRIKLTPLAVRGPSPNYQTARELPRFPFFFFLKYIVLFSHKVMSDSFATPWAAARRAPQSMGFPRPEYWIRLPFAPPGDLPNPRIQPTSPALAGGFFTPESPGKPLKKYICLKILFSPHIPQCSYLTAKEMGVQKTCGQNHGVSSLQNSGQVLFCISGGIFVGKQT